MVARRKLEEFWPVLDRTAFRIGRRINQPRYPREADRAGTHRTRFESHIKRCSGQPFICQT